MQMSRDVVTLQGLSVNPDELGRTVFGPRWQHDVVQPLPVLFHAQVKLVGIFQKVWQVKELWDQLPQVSHVVARGRVPRLLHAVEHPVGQVKEATLFQESWG